MVALDPDQAGAKPEAEIDPSPIETLQRRVLDLELSHLALCDHLGVDPESLRVDLEVREAGGCGRARG